jgi:hypothetical protein
VRISRQRKLGAVARLPRGDDPEMVAHSLDMTAAVGLDLSDASEINR